MLNNELCYLYVSAIHGPGWAKQNQHYKTLSLIWDCTRERKSKCMTSGCVRHSNWFIYQMSELCFFSSGLMLSPLLEDKKRDSLHCIKQYITKYFMGYTALAVCYRAAVLHWCKPLWREGNRRRESKHLRNAFMITYIHVKIVILKGGAAFGSKGQTNWDG